MAGMDRVGDLFAQRPVSAPGGEGARVMKAAVAHLVPFIEAERVAAGGDAATRPPPRDAS